MNRVAKVALSLAFLAGNVPTLGASENLRLNPRLNYSSDSLDGPLISGDHMDETTSAGKPNYIIFLGEGCFNSKRQARRRRLPGQVGRDRSQRRIEHHQIQKGCSHGGCALG
jgi:hypothetical protein